MAKMTEEQKIAAAEKRRAKAAEKDNEIAELKKQIAEMAAQMEAMKAPQVVQVNADVERVHFMWMAEVADDNVVAFGENGMYGRIQGKSGSFWVPKPDISRVLDSAAKLYLEKRWLIVVSGLDEEEREALGVNYKEGELLDRQAFQKLVEMGDDIIDIYPHLCKGHREMVAKRYLEAYNSHSGIVTRSRVVKLNQLSKELGSEKGDFTPIIEAMNEADAG